MAFEYTVGTGGDYATWRAAYNYLVSLGTLYDDYTFTQISDTVEPSASPAYLYTNGKTVTYKVDPSNQHNGNPNSGYRSVLIGGTGIRGVFLGAGRLGRFVVDGLYLICSFSTGTGLEIDGGYTNYGSNCEIKNCMIVGNDSTNTDGITISKYMSSIITNCKIFGCYVGIDYLNYSTSTHVVENLGIYDSYKGINMYRGYYTMRNVYCIVSFGFDWNEDIGKVNEINIINCADSDNSITGLTAPGTRINNIANIIAADEFLSLDNTSSDYLIPLSGGQIATGGIIPTYSGSTDIAGVDRPGADGYYAIGCHEPSSDAIVYTLRPVIPTNETFSNQLIWTMTDYLLSGSTTTAGLNSIKLYIDNIEIVHRNKFVNKKTGFEKSKYVLHNTTGDDILIDIMITFVGNAPRWFMQQLIQLAKAINGAGMDIEFRDDIATDYIYTGKWVNAQDFVENSEILTGGTMRLSCYKWEAIT